MAGDQSNAVPAAFGPNRMEEVWSKPPFERAKPFWEALQWLKSGHWMGIISEERAQELRQGILDGIKRTTGDLARQYGEDGTWRNRDWPMWRMNQTSSEDPLCVYRTGIIPPRIACWPTDAPHPQDDLELTRLLEEMRAWSFTPAARATFSVEELEQMREDADTLFGEHWRKLGG